MSDLDQRPKSQQAFLIDKRLAGGSSGAALRRPAEGGRGKTLTPALVL